MRSAAAPVPLSGPRVPRRGAWTRFYARFSHNPLHVVAAGFAIVIVASSLLAPVIAPTRYDFANIAESLQQPSVRHWLGTDAVGRDVLSRLLYGGRTSLEVVLSVVGLGITAGGALGLLAGFSGGPVKYVVLRLAEILTALPTILFAMLLLSILG